MEESAWISIDFLLCPKYTENVCDFPGKNFIAFKRNSSGEDSLDSNMFSVAGTYRLCYSAASEESSFHFVLKFF